ncbi:MAG: sugar ABC transporter ATP-binding protein [Eubacteriales bacterium]|nr:sugar ABC transporter ATP-binding protein [Eubacteriales bacterium]
MANKDIIIRVEKLCKTFVTTRAVVNATVDFRSGEIHALIGENGSGKSTLTSMMCGINKPDSGTMFLNKKPFIAQDQIHANENGIAALVQEMNTIDHMSVAENIFLGRENEFIKLGMIDKKRMSRAASEVLEKYGLKMINPNTDISRLSFEDRKIIEIIKAMNTDPKILIVDETTTALSQKGRDLLYSIMNDMRERGNTIVFISHDLQEVIEKSDAITVMRDGEIVDTIEVKDKTTEDELKMLMIGRELSQKYYRSDYGRLVSDDIVLEVKNVTQEGVLDDVTFELHKGEILGIGGLTSCGMHELGKVLFGASKAQKGSVTVTHKNAIVKNIPYAIKNGIAYISKNRDQESLMLISSISDNICLPSLDRISGKGLLRHKNENIFAQAGARKLDIKMENIEQYVFYLSGGNKQKVALAKWICEEPDIIVMDCPTRGIDVKVKAAIYSMMDKMVESGISIIMISEEMLELIGMCDRLLVFNKGKLVADMPRNKELSEETVIKYLI